MMLEQVAGAPFAAGFLVRDGREREAARQLVAVLVQQGVGNEAGDSAALHVGGAASVETPILDGAAPRTAVAPMLVATGREHVNVAVEDEMPPNALRVEGREQVGHMRLRRDDP